MSKFSLGQSISRIEDLTLVRGAGRYADDVRLANEAHAFVVRSPHAHASIRRIDADRRAQGGGRARGAYRCGREGRRPRARSRA